jgi:hypothetical protein
MSGNRPSGGKVSNSLVSAAVPAHMHSSNPCTPSSFQGDMSHTDASTWQLMPTINSQKVHCRCTTWCPPGQPPASGVRF